MRLLQHALALAAAITLIMPTVATAAAQAPPILSVSPDCAQPGDGVELFRATRCAENALQYLRWGSAIP
jgi:hypothetical protein